MQKKKKKKRKQREKVARAGETYPNSTTGCRRGYRNSLTGSFAPDMGQTTSLHIIRVSFTMVVAHAEGVAAEGKIEWMKTIDDGR